MEQLRYRTLEQHKVLFALLDKLNIMDSRGDLAFDYSQGRTERTSRLTIQECQTLIDDLNHQLGGQKVKQFDRPNLMRKRKAFFAICYKLGWTNDDGKLDYPRINNWLLKYGYLRKPINDYKDNELVKLIAQMDRMLEKMQDEK